MIPGFVRVSVKGQQCQRFVNLCRGREMDLKRIIRTGETELQLTMKVADFLQISPLRRKTGVHIHILKKKGPLFFLLFCKKGRSEFRKAASGGEEKESYKCLSYPFRQEKR